MDDRGSPHAADDFRKFGYLFKPAIVRMLGARQQPLLIGHEGLLECEAAEHWYEAERFLFDCACEMRAAADPASCRDAGHGEGNDNGFPRFYAVPRATFRFSDAVKGVCEDPPLGFAFG